jgi:hypothetical protein
MATFWAIVKNETRQLLRRRSFWVIQVLLLLPSPLIGFGPPIATTLVLLYLVLPILAGPPLLRDAGRSGEILWSSPTGALVHFAGVLAGLWLGLALGSLLQITAWFLADLFFPNSFSLWIYPLSLTGDAAAADRPPAHRLDGILALDLPGCHFLSFPVRGFQSHAGQDFHQYLLP